MLRTKAARKLLTKKEQKHLTEMKISSLRAFKELRSAQVDMRGKNKTEPCFECKAIAIKLGLK